MHTKPIIIINIYNSICHHTQNHTAPATSYEDLSNVLQDCTPNNLYWDY